MRRWMWAVLALAILGAVALAITRGSGGAAAIESEPLDSATAVRKTILASISASGSVEPVAQVSLNFSTPGTVSEVAVAEGQVVRQGDVLARLDAAELELAVQQAEQALIMQEVAYSQTLAPRPEDVEAARAQYSSALASLQALLKPDPLQVDIASKQADVAYETRYQVEQRWNQVKDAPIGGLPRDLLQSQFAQAVLQAQIADLQYQIASRGGTAAQVAGARAQVAQTQAALNRLVNDDRARQLAAAQLRQAELNLKLARLRLQRSTLAAAFDGTIAEVNIDVGQTVGASVLPAIVLADLTAFHIDVGVDEIDVGRLSDGLKANLNVDALPGVSVTGVVERIAPTARENAGVVSYIVTVAIDAADAPLRAGMSTIVDIVTDRRDNVLVVPNRFIRIDRNTGRAYVNARRGDQVGEVEIITGLRNDSESEVLQGLNEGDEVVILPNTNSFFGP